MPEASFTVSISASDAQLSCFKDEDEPEHEWRQRFDALQGKWVIVVHATNGDVQKELMSPPFMPDLFYSQAAAALRLIADNLPPKQNA